MIAPVAQWIEHLTSDQAVERSNRSGGVCIWMIAPKSCETYSLPSRSGKLPGVGTILRSSEFSTNDVHLPRR